MRLFWLVKTTGVARSTAVLTYQQLEFWMFWLVNTSGVAKAPAVLDGQHNASSFKAVRAGKHNQSS